MTIKPSHTDCYKQNNALKTIGWQISKGTYTNP